MIVSWARASGRTVKRPRRGDIVAFGWGGTGSTSDHVGLVVRVLALRWRSGKFTGWISTVEGNTGDGVKLRRRWCNAISSTYVRVG
jgi:hypothetical protein